jgi:TonB family protein
MRIKQILVTGLAVLSLAWPGSVSAQAERRAVAKPVPAYPEVARRLGLKGKVKIEATVGENGEIKHTNVIGGHPVLVDAALETLKRWRYEPSKNETIVTIQFEFHP